MKRKPKAAPARPANPLVGDNAAETISRCHDVAMFVTFTAVSLLEAGSNSDANNGLAIIMEGMTDALDVALAQAGEEEQP